MQEAPSRGNARWTAKQVHADRHKQAPKSLLVRHGSQTERDSLARVMDP
jgi:hypothetical protein